MAVKEIRICDVCGKAENDDKEGIWETTSLEVNYSGYIRESVFAGDVCKRCRHDIVTAVEYSVKKVFQHIKDDQVECPPTKGMGAIFGRDGDYVHVEEVVEDNGGVKTSFRTQNGIDVAAEVIKADQQVLIEKYGERFMKNLIKMCATGYFFDETKNELDRRAELGNT